MSQTTAFVLSLEPVVYITVKHKRRSLTSWWDKIPDANLGNGSNEMMMTIGEHEDNAGKSKNLR